jgi:hypothetical protein
LNRVSGGKEGKSSEGKERRPRPREGRGIPMGVQSGLTMAACGGEKGRGNKESSQVFSHGSSRKSPMSVSPRK